MEKVNDMRPVFRDRPEMYICCAKTHGNAPKTELINQTENAWVSRDTVVSCSTAHFTLRPTLVQQQHIVIR